MSFTRYFEKISFLDYLIRRKATGDQKQFARKAKLSRSMLNEYLKEMKELGFPISYCRERKTYYYEEDGNMVKSLFVLKVESKEMKAYEGGVAPQPEFFAVEEETCNRVFTFPSPIILDWAL